MGELGAANIHNRPWNVPENSGFHEGCQALFPSCGFGVLMKKLKENC